MKIKEYLRKIRWPRLIIGLMAGGIIGFLYYYYIGCKTGTCPIKSNPWLMTGYGMLFGGVLLFSTKAEKGDVN